MILIDILRFLISNKVTVNGTMSTRGMAASYITMLEGLLE